MNKKICVVGGGYWGEKHLLTLSKLNALAGIVDSNLDQLKLIQSKYPEIKCFTELDKAINYGFDGFTVVTPSESHFSIAKKIINSNNNVLVEKPLTICYEEAKELVKSAKNCNVTLMVGHLLLFHPAIMKIKEYINSGKLGQLQYIYSNRLNLGQVRSKENVFWSFAPHDISILQYFIESDPLDINSSGASFLQKGIHDSTITVLKYPENITAHIFVSWLHPFKEHRIVVIGSKGMISFEDSHIDKPLKFYKKKYTIDNHSIPKKSDGDVELISYDLTPPLLLQMEHFINNLDCNNQDFKCSGYEGSKVIKILEEATLQLS